LRIANQVGSLGLRAQTTFHLGLVSYSLGDYRQASTLLAKNIAVLQGDLVGERFGYPTPPGINSLTWLVRSQAELGNFAEAMRVGEDGLRIAERTESPWSIAQTCLGIGGALAIRGALAEAIPLLERGLAICESSEFYLPGAMTASYLAYAYALSGRLSDSLPLLGRPTNFGLRPEFRSGYPRLLVTLGEVYLLAGQAAEAVRFAELSLARSRQHRHRADEALALRLVAEIAAGREPPDVGEAEARYREGLALAEELGNRPLVAHCHLGLGKLYGRADKPEPAREHLTTAVTMYREMGMRFWLEQAEAEMRALD
jgi:tetratricopeptide (TPR) repeat protein